MQGKELDKFMERVLVFVDRNGTLETKSGTPMSCSIKMSYNKDRLQINMHAYSHGMGNGSCGAEVTYKGTQVFKAYGGFTSTCHNVVATTFKRGDWEKIVAP